MEERDTELTDGQLLCWGCGEFGQHCHAHHSDVPFVQSQVTHFKGDNHKQRVKYVGCGASHNIVVTESDEIFAWGNGNSGQLGCSNLSTRLEPTQVHLPGAEGVQIAGVSCGGRHTMIWLKNGHVYSFGNNFYAQLGYDFKDKDYKENQLQPKLINFLIYRHVSHVASGDKHTLFLFTDGSLAAMGNNIHGQIGNDSRKEAVVPVTVHLDKPVSHIASGANHCLAVAADGCVYHWGYGRACGHRRHDVLEPQKILEGHHVVQVAGGATQSMALTASGNIYIWGSGVDGQLGHKSKTFLSGPRKIKDGHLMNKVVHIACGEAFSAAVTVSGKLYMWGKNSHTLVPDQRSSFRVYEPKCLNPDLNKKVETVYCGAWHAAAITGANKRVLSQLVSESESSEEETGSVSSLVSETRDEEVMLKEEVIGDVPVFESDLLEISAPPLRNEKTLAPKGPKHVSLEEFYAPTPELSRSDPSADSISTVSCHTDPGRQLVVQVPGTGTDSDQSSDVSFHSKLSHDTPLREITLPILSEPLPEPTPPRSTIHSAFEKNKTKMNSAKPRATYNRSKTTMSDNPHHTVQVSRHIANKYALPRENTQLFSKHVAFVDAFDLKRAGTLIFDQNNAPNRGDVSPEDPGMWSIEKQRQYLTAILKQAGPAEASPASSGQNFRVQRSKTFASLNGHTRSNYRYFLRKKPSLNQLAARNAQARAQILNPKSLKRLAGTGENLDKFTNDLPDGSLIQDNRGLGIERESEKRLSPKTPMFSSASSWRDRVMVAGQTSNKSSSAQTTGRRQDDDRTQMKVKSKNQGVGSEAIYSPPQRRNETIVWTKRTVDGFPGTGKHFGSSQGTAFSGGYDNTSPVPVTSVGALQTTDDVFPDRPTVSGMTRFGLSPRADGLYTG